MGMDKWTLWHVGISVKNMDQAVAYYKSLGGTADDAPGHVLDSARFKDFKTYGKTGAPIWKIKIKMVSLGPLMLELTEPVEGGNYNETYMDKNGEGANHLAYQVEDLEKEVKEMADKGVPIMYHAKGEYAYLDTRKVGGVVIELFQKRNQPPPAARK
jgi:methylmalonyl-CoA/ethylmalonyl-CoA epimerase